MSDEPNVEATAELNQDVPDAKPKRDRSTTPQDLIDKATRGVNELLLTRAIHFHPGGGGSGSCFAGTVTHVGEAPESGPTTVSAFVLPRAAYESVTRTGGLQGQPILVTHLPVTSPSSDPNPTAHLSRDCPWGR